MTGIYSVVWLVFTQYSLAYIYITRSIYSHCWGDWYLLSSLTGIYSVFTRIYINYSQHLLALLTWLVLCTLLTLLSYVKFRNTDRKGGIWKQLTPTLLTLLTYADITDITHRYKSGMRHEGEVYESNFCLYLLTLLTWQTLFILLTLLAYVNQEWESKRRDLKARHAYITDITDTYWHYWHYSRMSIRDRTCSREICRQLGRILPTLLTLLLTLLLLRRVNQGLDMKRCDLKATHA